MKKILPYVIISIFLCSNVAFTHWATPAKQSNTDTTNFDGNLSGTDVNVQTALETIDDVVLGGDSTETNQDDAWKAVLDGTGTETFIDVTYQDGTNDVDFVVPVIDDDTFATAADTTLATSESIKAYVDNTAYIPGGTDVPITDGGTGSSTATAAASALGVGTEDSPQFTGIELSHATENTLTASGGDVSVEGNVIYRAGGTDAPVTDGGTGVSTLTTAYGLLAAGTTATGNVQTLAAGATTEVLVGGGASALPIWTTAQGSGAPVRATSPTLTSPVIGAATGTSLITTGALSSGTDGSVTGVLNSYGNATSSGGTAVFHNSNDEDGSYETVELEADGSNFNMSWGGDEFVFNQAGIVNPDANPSLCGYDDDWSENTWCISDGTSEDADDGEMHFLVKVDNATAVFVDLDGVNERVDFNYPPNGGVIFAALTGADVDLSSSALCEATYYLDGSASSDEAFTLPDSGLCNGIAGYGKKFHFVNSDATYDLDINAEATTDSIIQADGTDCGADKDLMLETAGEWVTIIGVSTTTWRVIAGNGDGCES